MRRVHNVVELPQEAVDAHFDPRSQKQNRYLERYGLNLNRYNIIEKPPRRWRHRNPLDNDICVRISMQEQQPSDVDDGRGDSDLPSSLPSYMPASSSQSISGASLYSYKRLNQSLAKPDADGSPRQWNTRPVIDRRSTSARSTDTAALNDSHLSRLQPSPSEGMRSMTFRDGGGFQMQTEQDQAMRPIATTGTSMTVAGRQTAASVSQISAAQFAASTGGLSMDTALLARVSGTDPSLMGSEDIKQIMRTPDLLSIYQKLQEEDDRRQRRLERNRASARVRREKKKGMVETYEGEVSKLETALNILKKHEFGTGNARELATALGMYVDACGIRYRAGVE